MAEEKKYVVRDYMSDRGVRTQQTASLRTVVDLMIKEKTNGVVVVDEQNKVIGILSSWDIIKRIVPDYLEDDKHLASFEAESQFAERIHEVADDPIEAFMTKNVFTLSPDDSLMEAAAKLAEHGIRQLPVVDAQGVLVGYLNRTDLKQAIGQVLGLI